MILEGDSSIKFLVWFSIVLGWVLNLASSTQGSRACDYDKRWDGEPRLKTSGHVSVLLGPRHAHRGQCKRCDGKPCEMIYQ